MHSFLRKVPGSAKDAGPTRSTLGEIFGVDFEKNQKNVKNVSKKTYIVLLMIEKIFFSKTKGEIEYSKRYKTMTVPVS